MLASEADDGDASPVARPSARYGGWQKIGALAADFKKLVDQGTQKK
jgi:hypothetical protein